MGVPRIIHQIWIHHDDIPLYKYDIKHIQSWKNNHPTWKYNLWSMSDCDQLIETHFPRIKSQYDAGQYVVKADICRVAVLIIHGGIYADLDTECFKSFDSLVDDVDVTIKNNSNSFFMAPKGAVFLEKFMEYLYEKRNVHQPLLFAGPLAILDFEKRLEDDGCFRNEGTFCEKNGLRHEGAFAIHYSIKNWMCSYLVVGSAPYVPEWLKQNRSELNRRGVEFCPINNAWCLFEPRDISIWTYPCDLPKRGTRLPSKEQMSSMSDVREFMPKFYRRTYNGNTKKQNVTWQKSFTMMIDTVYMLINADKATKIYVVGCDMIYNYSKDDYFYGNDPKCKGTPDPMRHGRECILAELNRLNDYAKERNIEIYNLSPQDESLLPFKRKRVNTI